MRIIRYILDLPWWSGFILFLIGNWLVCYCYILGVLCSLFGAWTFTRLLAPTDPDEPSPALIGFPLFFLIMLIPNHFAFTSPWLTWLNEASPTVLYGVRAALGLFFGMMASLNTRDS